MAKHWYLQPDAIAIISRIIANPPELVCHTRQYVLTSDEWATYESVDVDALAAIWDAAFKAVSDTLPWNRELAAAVIDVSPQDVVHATLLTYPFNFGLDYRGKIDAIARQITCALSRRKTLKLAVAS